MGPLKTEGSINSQKIYSDLSSEYKNGEKKNPEGFSKNLSSVINISEEKPILTKPDSLTSSAEKTFDTLYSSCITKIKSVFGMSTNRQAYASDGDVEKEIFLKDGRTHKMILEQEKTKKTNNSGVGKNNSSVKKLIVYSAAVAAILGLGYFSREMLSGENSSHDEGLPDGLKPDNSSDMSTIEGLEKGVSQAYSGWKSEYSNTPVVKFDSDDAELSGSGDGNDYDSEYSSGYKDDNDRVD
ncbi:hypothetical protein [Erwinia mallotivora]|uniref:hypothetical protein n=1 Tax=Erwinia mallotivora TaxID=69222 RepID=UPI0021BFE772|nr:hypothetical protein [Erwinia mallotivora]